MLKLTDYVGLGVAEYSDELIGLRLSTRLHVGKGAKPSWRDVIISGVSPLALTKAFELNYIKALGKCEQNDTPSPDNPVNIVCNNGILKVRNKSGLPLGYQAVEYLQSSGTQYIDTGVPLDDTMTIRIKYDFIRAGFVFGSRSSSSSRYSGITNETGGSYIIRYGNTVIYSQNTTPAGTVDVVISPNGVVLNGETVSTTAYGDSFYAGNCYLFTSNSNGSPYTGVYAINRVRRFTIDNVIDLIPCKRKSDDVLGMYDLVNDTFLTNSGSDDFIAGQDVNDMEIYADGTQETVKVTSKNLFNKNAILENTRYTNNTGYEYGSTGDAITVIGRFVSGLVPVQVGNTYTKNTTADAYHRIKIYDSNKICLRIVDNTNTITIQQGEAYIAISGYLTEIDSIQLEQGSTSTTYEPYFNGGTATAEMLLKVSNYLDKQEILTGKITRNVGIKIFDGTETWTVNIGSNVHFAYMILDGINVDTGETAPDILCSHYIPNRKNYVAADNSVSVRSNKNGFLFTDYLHINSVDSWKQWLSDQYNAGTPVIVIYPLETPTTETVTKQTLTASGNCTVTATGSLDSLSLEVSYKQGL